MADFALDVSMLRAPGSSYGRVTALIEAAAASEGLEVERWEEGACRSEVLWIPYLRVPADAPERLVVTCHDLNPLLPDGRPLWKRWWRARRYRASVERAGRRAWRLCTGSQDAAERIEREFAGLGDRVKVVPWFLTGDYTDRVDEEDPARRARLGLGAGYVLYLGAFRPHKNWTMALRAFAGLPAGLRARHPLVLVGRRHRAERELEQRLAESGLTGDVHLLEDLDGADLPALYRGAAAFLFPSRLEGFGLPPLEAQACGVPVLSSNTTSLPEVVGPAARLDPDDQRGWTDALEELLTDPSSREEQRRRGLENVARFSAERTGRAIRELVTG